MESTWDILLKELSFYGITVEENNSCTFNFNGSSQKQTIKQLIKIIQQDIKNNKNVFSDLWTDALLLLTGVSGHISDIASRDIFLFAIKDMVLLLRNFEEIRQTRLFEDYNKVLSRDINSFSQEAIQKIPGYKISIDWVLRSMHRLIYICKMLLFALQGKEYISNYKLANHQDPKIVLAIWTSETGGGPWSNLDLPMQERKWDWDEEGENLGETEKGKQAQRRYRKGLMNYPKMTDPEEGFFWVWPDLQRNQPWSWYNRKYEDVYPHRDYLQRP